LKPLDDRLGEEAMRNAAIRTAFGARRGSPTRPAAKVFTPTLPVSHGNQRRTGCRPGVSPGFCAPIDERIHVPFHGEEREPGLIIRPSLGRVRAGSISPELRPDVLQIRRTLHRRTPGPLSTCVYTMV
jgi:hypothetical protein